MWVFGDRVGWWKETLKMSLGDVDKIHDVGKELLKTNKVVDTHAI